MTPEEITRLWQLSMDDAEGMRLGFTTQQHYFAVLVAAAEREACAYRAGIALLGADRGLANRVDQAIRARGQNL